ncbi:MAG: UDP-3-O-acyl-N-acetylglucosamine deacetylase [Exilispira sp.]
MKRKTIKKPITRSGISIHSGKITALTFKPSFYNKGIIFYNTLKDPYRLYPIPLSPFVVTKTNNSTCIGLKNTINTVEHLLSALFAFHISDLIIEVEGDEIPIFDGSAYYFIEMIREAGIKELEENQNVLKINYPIWVISDDKYIIAMPSSKFSITYSIDFSSKTNLLPYQVIYLTLDADTYIKEVSRARTFGFLEDIEYLKNNNLALGGSLENALIYTREGILNKDIRYHDEAIRHKVLDLVGDLYLLSRPIEGHIIAHKAGHSLDVQFAKKLYWAEFNKSSEENIKKIIDDFEKLTNKLKISINQNF